MFFTFKEEAPKNLKEFYTGRNSLLIPTKTKYFPALLVEEDLRCSLVHYFRTKWAP
jgi:hypothetical protein